MNMYKLSFKIVMAFSLLLISVTAFSQKGNDSVAYISTYPVKEGYIYYYKDELPAYNDPAPCVYIFSKENEVFALMEGKVIRIFNLDDGEHVMIKKGDTCAVYGNMDSLYKKVGDTVHKGELIGKIKWDESNNRYELMFNITVRLKSMLYPEYIGFLKQYR